MAYHTITVLLDDMDFAPELLTAATKLANEYTSHLIGLFIMHPLDIYVARISEELYSSELTDIINKDQIQRMAALKSLFDERTSKQSFTSEWRSIENTTDPIVDVLMRQAATTDLLVLANDRSTKHKDETKTLIEKALLDAPVPTLLVPKDMQCESIGHHVMVGWDGTTVARRAISAAMPLLQSAEQVWVHRVFGEINEEQFKHNTEIDLANMLSRHGVSTELSKGADNNIAGDSLLEEARLRGADVLVAGAFGHSRIRDIILGSTTNYLINNSHIPLLMMH